MLRLYSKVILFFLVCLNFNIYSQSDNFYSSSSILSKLEKLNTLGKVLYVAAHPDDENTRLITYLSNEKKYETAYLSLTRGDGGQNLIGKDLKENLGLIRTQELLEARKIDGGIQLFTSAIDFGYSKTSKESLEFWDEDQILYELVWIIRKFKPDVIIIDGGSGQFNSAKKIITNLKLNIKLISISKGKDRNKGREIIHTLNQNIKLKTNDILLHFLQLPRLQCIQRLL